MRSVVYVFRIDAFSPGTLPMARLADYMAQLAKLIGHAEHTHFIGVEEGSAKLVHTVDEEDAEGVRGRLSDVAAGTGPKDALAARAKLDDLLAEDQAVGELCERGGAVILPFPGRLREKPLTFPAFRQDGAIEGQVVSIGGKDASAHAILQDGDITLTGLTMKRGLARDLAQYLYGPKVRLTGNGRWERHPDGAWKLLEFRVEGFKTLDEKPLAEVLQELRRLPGNGLMKDSAYRDVINLSSDDGALH
jgi:hypothetical protein